MKIAVRDAAKKLWIVLSTTVHSFRKNNGLTAASSLAFSATLALIPSLFLLTVLLGAAIGSSAKALLKTQELLTQMIPAYSQDILREVRFITNHQGAISTANILILFWTITPLVSDMRHALGVVYRKKPTRPFLMEKLFDVAIAFVFLVGITVISVTGIVFTLTQKLGHLPFLPGYLMGAAPFLFIAAVAFSLYFIFSPPMRFSHLAAGAFIASLLWFAIRPVFHLFLIYNPGYGLTFGSFKSLFVVIIWIYVSIVVFLLGAEFTSVISRKETLFLATALEGHEGIPESIINRYVITREKGSLVFRQGDMAREMYVVRRGRVALRKNEQEIAVILPGDFFGERDFLLETPRTATAVVLDDLELVEIGHNGISSLLMESPAFVLEMLKKMACRLRDAEDLNDTSSDMGCGSKVCPMPGVYSGSGGERESANKTVSSFTGPDKPVSSG